MENNETKPNEPINIIYNSANVISTTGLTKREYFAAMAMQGALANKSAHEKTMEMITKSAVKLADILIEELNKTK